jgi:hypothetical protein
MCAGVGRDAFGGTLPRAARNETEYKRAAAPEQPARREIDETLTPPIVVAGKLALANRPRRRQDVSKSGGRSGMLADCEDDLPDPRQGAIRRAA